MSSSPILKFRGQHEYLSNFFLCDFVWEGIKWAHAEAAYQAAKAPRSERLRFSHMTPQESKREGKRCYIQENWDEVKIEIMHSIVREKFCQNLHLLERLIATGNVLIQEGNWWNDQFWGICPEGSGKGRNELGKILMELRAEFNTNPEKQCIIHYL